MTDRDRSESAERLLLGVCANFADKSRWNVWTVRLFWTIAALVLSPPVAGLFYVFTWWLTREDDA